jgi:mono/diheme cytochrome c family protein
MDNQPKWDPQEATGFFADGRNPRVTPEHAVPFASFDFDPAAHADAEWAGSFLGERETMLAADDGVYRGVETLGDGTESYLDYIPVQVSREMLEHGRDMFNIYCAACHGYLGDGKGMVGTRWSYPPANLTGEVYRDRSNRQGKDGYLFEVTREGLWSPDGSNRMPGYGHALDEMDTWAVVAYLRALQKARGSDWAALPEDDRAKLGQPTPAPAESGSTNSTDTDGGDS